MNERNLTIFGATGDIGGEFLSAHILPREDRRKSVKVITSRDQFYHNEGESIHPDILALIANKKIHISDLAGAKDMPKPERVTQFLETQLGIENNHSIIDVSLGGVEFAEEIMKILKWSRNNLAAAANKTPFAYLDQASAEWLNASDQFGFRALTMAHIDAIKEFQKFANEHRVVFMRIAASGTCGYTSSALYDGDLASETVRVAEGKGITESDPTKDFSGDDTADKAIIDARIAKMKADRTKIQQEPYFPREYMKMAPLDSQEKLRGFFKKLKELDEAFRVRFEKAKKEGEIPKYIAEIRRGENDVADISIGLQNVPINDPLGKLEGPENGIYAVAEDGEEFYRKGPGAGTKLTADAVCKDLEELEDKLN